MGNAPAQSIRKSVYHTGTADHKGHVLGLRRRLVGGGNPAEQSVRMEPPFNSASAPNEEVKII